MDLKTKTRFADVVVNLPINRSFSYAVPENITGIAQGSMVLVPFGKSTVTGYVTGFIDEAPVKGMKKIIELLYPEPVFDEGTLKFFRESADRYFVPVSEVLRMAVPPGVKSKSEILIRLGRERCLIPGQKENALLVELERAGSMAVNRALKFSGLDMAALRSLKQRGAIDFFTGAADSSVRGKYEKYAQLSKPIHAEAHPKSGKAAQVIGLFKENQKIALKDVEKTIKGGARAVRKLADEGILSLFEVENLREPYLEKTVERDFMPVLYPDQAFALEKINGSISAQKHETFLLYGITGSGKTEVYLRAISQALETGRTALALVPEIALTPQFIHRFRARFGEIIAVIHSNMSKGERFDQWRKILKGEAKIVIGARSALFAPLSNIGIIVVDEEHDPSYKQEDRLMYHARDLAVLRASLADAVCVLGSATPSMESYHRALTGEYRLLKLASRMSGYGLADVRIVDLRKEKGKLGKRGFLSDELLDSIRENYLQGGKTILFLNRRGYSSFVLCRQCGVAVRCPHCSVAMKYHYDLDRLICHYCNHTSDISGFCSTCGAKAMTRCGFGTEQVEKEIKTHFPDLNVERMDRDTTSRKFSHEKIIKRLESGRIDILIGTQMVSKGLDAKLVTLVGVVLADVSLNIPDFRSCERTFSLLTQVAGRSGRGEKRGKVIIQTYSPEHYSISEAAKQDFVNFYEQEISIRRDVGYPPFSRLINVRFSSNDPDTLHKEMKKVKRIAQKTIDLDQSFKGKIEILGPSPAPIEKLKGQYRWQMLFKIMDGSSFKDYVAGLSKKLSEELKRTQDFSFRIDIDPHNFM